MVLLLIWLAGFLTGCASDKTITLNYCYLNPDKNLCALGRVALIELNNDTTYPQASSDITDALFQAIQKRQVFGLTAVRRNETLYQTLQISPNSAMTLEILSNAQKTLDCSAILVGTVTEYQPYPNLIICLRLKIIDLRDGQLVWALEQIWDGSDKTTRALIKEYYKSQARINSAGLAEKLVNVSPLEFMKFVGYEVAKTLR